MSAVLDALDRDAYERDPTLFWLWPERWLETPINKATQKFEAFWRFIPRVRDWLRVKGAGGSIGDELGVFSLARNTDDPLIDGQVKRDRARNAMVAAENLARQRGLGGAGKWGLLSRPAFRPEACEALKVYASVDDVPDGTIAYRCLRCGSTHARRI